MSKNDELDVVLQKITDREDWESLKEVCKYEALDIDDLTKQGLVKAFNKEIRRNYGNTLKNIFRDEYSPDYSDIVKAVAAKFKITVPKGTLSEYDIRCIEEQLLIVILETTKEKIIKEKGYAAWEDIEKEASDSFEAIYKDGKISLDEYEEIKGKIISGGMLATIIAGKLSGFAIYMLTNQLFFAVSRYLGLGIGVAVAGPVIGKSLAFLLGPAGWVLTGLWVLYGLGGTNWEKTIGAVLIIGAFRKKQEFVSRLK
ncbi:hypothetical protein [Phascolarctobacterium sp.]